MNSQNNLVITVGARGSTLSQKQVWEVHEELLSFHPEVAFVPQWISTSGDQDLTKSLRDMENSDFFTKEIDELQLAGSFRIAIHSAKDLPRPLASGLSLVALTRGQDPSDVLVLHTSKIGKQPRIATSSKRREQTILSLIPDAQIVDIRGTIEKRLESLARGSFDGLVVAEAALIRLGLTSLFRLKLPPPVAPYQGRLAIVSRCEDREMQELFTSLDTRQK